ncbi:MAG: A24 family peptidase [Actinobacteria bacterium]|nr:A24 family peptidase [Actinomycetota bacterium]
MPTPLLACLLAVALAGVLTAVTSALLRWCPLPDDATDLDGAELPPFVELVTHRFRWEVFGVSAVAGATMFLLTDPRDWAVWAPLATIGTLLGVVDRRTSYLPLRLNYLALALAVVGAGVAASLRASWQVLLWAGITGVVATGFFWVIWRLSGDRFGFGDVRLAGLIGVVTGTRSATLTVWAFLLGSVVGAVWGGVAWARRGRDGEFAYGPAMLLGPPLALVVSRVLRLG